MLKIKSSSTFTMLYKMLFDVVKFELDEKIRYNLISGKWSEMCMLLDMNHALVSHVKDADSYDCEGCDGMHLTSLRKVDEYYNTVRGFNFDVKVIYDIMR